MSRKRRAIHLPINWPSARTQLSGGVPYTVNNTASIPIDSLPVIGYYLELQASGGPLQWVYASFDAAPFSNDASKLGVPIASTTGRVLQLRQHDDHQHGRALERAGHRDGKLTSAPASSSSGPVITREGNGYGVPNATGGNLAWARRCRRTNPGYGSMKIGNYGAQQMLISFNNWNTGIPPYDVGIGNGSTSDTIMTILLHETPGITW